nr:immunoglobulin light chain junction region [Macaca mulatta]MOX25224.1 immunoglobulin light chain junction region [Macaca mulatta]MOX25267.1 immunoglobulin light chain junction region [Macaca mulatta]MOX25423.1 immunoglobulin light chain junction region [Macaca mulatta]MOX25559.1 immunoglobulin light chain junction region [Macaca mulatta]
CLQYSSPPYSF